MDEHTTDSWTTNMKPEYNTPLPHYCVAGYKNTGVLQDRNLDVFVLFFVFSQKNNNNTK